MYSTAPHGDVRREIAHNAPPPVFHKKWNSNKQKKGSLKIAKKYRTACLLTSSLHSATETDTGKKQNSNKEQKFFQTVTTK